ncbi:hypothetical protein KJ781_04205 [Patescibacteria group bacterium]|nr:hypothetical protein [Patescibacteria group bacterium]MBU1448806.1 hypothetical protein [Patescibacteria group bacterium]
MYKSHQGNRSGGRKGSTSFGQQKPWDRGSGGRSDDRPMFKATCSECGDPCEVPFKPLPGRAIFCRNCFKKDDKSDQRGPMRSDARRFPSDEKRMYSAVCATCRQDCEVPFRPTGAKPIYCRSCMTGGGAPEKRTTDQYADQFKNINAKLDAILKAIAPKAVEAPAVIAEPVVKAKETVKKTKVPKKVAKIKVATKKDKKK